MADEADNVDKADGSAPWPMAPAQIELAFAQIEASAAFRRSPRHRRLLRHLVSRVLDGDTASLKESVIAVEALGRAAGSFDPKRDSVVRVEARRLRARLAAYYRGEGRDAALRIDLPIGSYVPSLSTRVVHDSRVSRRARDLVERGEHFLRQAMTGEALREAISRFDAALRDSPACVPAHVGLARAWFNMASGWYCDAAPAGDHAAEALRRALELDPSNALGWALLGATQYQFEHDWPAAERSLKRAVTLAPKAAFTHSAYGWQLVARGELAGGERELMVARELDPQYVNSRMHMVNLRIAQGRADDAQREIDAMNDLAPGSMAIAGMQGALALFRRDLPAALRHYERACALAPDHPTVPVLLAATLVMAGRHDAGARLLAETLERFKDRAMSPYVLAIHAIRCGAPDRAFAELHRALDERDPQAVLLALDPSFEELRDDARWPPLCARLGLVPPLPRTQLPMQERPSRLTSR